MLKIFKKYLAMLGIVVFILSVGQAVSYAKTGLRPSDEEYINEQEKVDCQYGCKASKNNDVKQVLNTWLEGIPKGFWYTKIVMDNMVEK